ncbi:MAG: hypothetical protein JXR83_08645 [Deltaproteobacteria bacterium]|nr:hypothetical protein [Deltaproteobacteria bacterium]
MNTDHLTGTLDRLSGDFARMERRLRCCFAVAEADDDCVPRHLLRDRLGSCRADFERMYAVMQKLMAN